MIINLTQHHASPDQRNCGVVDLEGRERDELKSLLTFGELPTLEEVARRADAIAEIASASGAKRVMIGGAPYLMAPLETSLRHRGIQPLYAFSQRESVEKTARDGGVIKTQVFKHLGFIGMGGMKIHAESHMDHNLSEEQITWLLEEFADKGEFFIETVTLPKRLGTIPSGLYGPLAGDKPVDETEVVHESCIA